MGKIVRPDTFQAIKNAAARAEARANSPIAKLDKRVVGMGTVYEAKQKYKQRRTGSKKSRHRYSPPTGWNPSNTTIFNIAMLAFLAFLFLPDYIGHQTLALPITGVIAGSRDTERASFSFCHSGGGTNCVVDGDTIWYQGNNIRIADIDTPETHPPSCAREGELGAAATQRLQSLLNAGAFSVQSIDRDTDRYGRQLRVLTRGGESIGGMLVADGLARWYEGGRQPWC